MTKEILFVGLGSFVGGALRYILSGAFSRVGREWAFPIGIMVVNVLGCFLIGLLYSYFKNRVGESLLPLLLMTGVLGGFTTFSTKNDKLFLWIFVKNDDLFLWII